MPRSSPLLLTASQTVGNTVTIVLRGLSEHAAAGVMVLDCDYYDWLEETGGIAMIASRLAQYHTARKKRPRARHRARRSSHEQPTIGHEWGESPARAD